MYYTTYFREVNNSTVVEYCYNDRTSLFPKVYVSSFNAVFVFTPTVILGGVYIIIIRKLKQLNECYFYQKSSVTGLKSDKHKKTNNSVAESNELAQPEFYTSSNSSNSYSMKVKYTPTNNNNLTTSTNLQQSMSLLGNKKTTLKSPHDRASLQLLKVNTHSQAGNHKKISLPTKANTDVNKVVSGKSSYGKNLIAKRNQTITICLISLAFFFCQIPIKIFQIFNAFYEFENESAENDLVRFKIINIIFLSSKLLFFLHGMSNPIM
jgi:hypothetical protein